MIATKTFLKDLLKTNDIEVKFKKKDGTQRQMLCTLREEVLPVKKESSEITTIKKENDNVLAVWDIEKNAFRSFRLDSLIEYSLKSHEQ